MDFSLLNRSNLLHHLRNKIKWWQFSSGTVIIHFWDKPCQEINFKLHWNTITFSIRKNLARFAYDPLDFIWYYLFSLLFAMKLNDANNKNLWNVLAFCDQWKMMSDLNLTHTKMSDFVSFSLFRFTLAIKLQNSDFKSHWNTFFLLKKSDDRFKYVLSSSVWSD